MKTSSGSDRVYNVGQIVSGRVDRVFPFGIFIQLEGNVRAYIRRRELSLEGDIDPGALVTEGQEIQAVVLQLAEPGKSMELSRRPLLHDPWHEFTDRFHKGDAVTATVRDLAPKGVFVRVAAGVNGFIPLDELAPWKVERPEDIVWVGDRLEAEIIEIDQARREIRLSVRRRMERLSRVEAIIERLHRAREIQSEEDALPGDYEQVSESGEKWAEGPKGLPPVLVVEDRDDIREPLVKWLILQGCTAQGAKTIPEALSFCQEQCYGLILVDLDLRKANGLSLIRMLRERGNLAAAAVMSIPEWIEEHFEEIQKLNVIAVFPKPLDLGEIRQLILRLAKGEKPELSLRPPASVAADHRPVQALATVMRSGQSLAKRFQQGLEQLVAATRAEMGIVFHLDPASQTVSIVAHFGVIPVNMAALYSLVDSPVKDIIREGGEILENRVSQERTARFRKLLDLLPFESCLGVPIEALGQVMHALFLFHREPDAFSRYRLRDAKAMATLFAVAFENQALDERIQELSRTLLSGHLAAAFGHEIYNKLSGLELQLRNLLSDFERLGREHPRLNDSLAFSQTKWALDKAVDTAMDLGRMAGDFRRLMESGREETADVNRAVRQAGELVRPLARRKKVELRLNLDEHLPLAKGSTLALQQVFLNLMLNAMQHMEDKQDDRRTVEITSAYEVGGNEPLVKVRCSDTGPGIHRQLWERIFALGFTTRPGGSGLGLYIARSLVESMGGRISVEESLVPLGTTFLVELLAAHDVGRTSSSPHPSQEHGA